jgi:uncharacterized protein YnzC (UPF0291/DUF896 family)
MEQAHIDRLNELGRKAKGADGLTEEEAAEREVLRRAYIDAYKQQLTAHLENTYIQYPDGTRKKLRKKGEPEQENGAEPGAEPPSEK